MDVCAENKRRNDAIEAEMLEIAAFAAEGSTRRQTAATVEGSTRRQTAAAAEEGSTRRQTAATVEGSTRRQTAAAAEEGSTRRQTAATVEGSTRRQTAATAEGSTRRQTAATVEGSTRRQTAAAAEEGSTRRQTAATVEGSTRRQTDAAAEEGSTRRQTAGAATGVAAVDAGRARMEFGYFCGRCLQVFDKQMCRMVPFVLNRAQWRLVGVLEEMRREGAPIRAIVLKARQWGCTTVLSAYMTWLSMFHYPGRHVLSMAHTRDTALMMRGKVEEFMAELPEVLTDGMELKARPYMRMSNTRIVSGPDTKLTVATANSVNSTRGHDVQLVHLSEVAFWRNTALTATADTVRAATAGVAPVAGTVVVMESTANGEANFFHSEWKRAERGESDKRAVFIPWYMNEAYRMEVVDPEGFFESLDEYERGLWDRHGCSLEQIMWYRVRRREYADVRHLRAEYPTTAAEAFSEVSNGVFAPADVEALAEDCREPDVTGEIEGMALCGPEALRGITLRPNSSGETFVWARPRSGTTASDYLAVVDIGGRTEGSDFSVITIFDRHLEQKIGRRPEVVATWRGHIDMDLLGWKAAAMAKFYSDARLIIESNSLDSDPSETGPYLLKTIGRHYRNLYRRRTSDMMGNADTKPGFHTNRRTKGALIANLVAKIRDGDYVERDSRCIAELMAYEKSPGGGYGARKGFHDDMLMTRAIGLYVNSEMAAVNHAEAARELIRMQGGRIGSE